MDKKRKAGALEGIPEAKRPTRPTTARSAAVGRSNSSSTAAGRGNSASAAAGRAGSAAAGAAAEAAAPKPEETWEDIAERTGLTAEAVLER